ncbi:MAG: MFS transporter, partial [Gammaproteobacteria bacterium]|nr:MFS transporter [Gammaproteobacteria bacterium]
FFLLALHADTPLVALSVMCGALAFIALTFSGYVPNFLDIAPRYADVLIGISNTFGTIPGIIGVALAGWLLDQTGSYAGVFMIVAAVQVVGGALWLLFATGEKIID